MKLLHSLFIGIYLLSAVLFSVTGLATFLRSEHLQTNDVIVFGMIMTAVLLFLAYAHYSVLRSAAYSTSAKVLTVSSCVNLIIILSAFLFASVCAGNNCSLLLYYLVLLPLALFVSTLVGLAVVRLNTYLRIVIVVAVIALSITALVISY